MYRNAIKNFFFLLKLAIYIFDTHTYLSIRANAFIIKYARGVLQDFAMENKKESESGENHLVREFLYIYLYV